CPSYPSPASKTGHTAHAASALHCLVACLVPLPLEGPIVPRVDMLPRRGWIQLNRRAEQGNASRWQLETQTCWSRKGPPRGQEVASALAA
ncbi:hypothetical protein CCMA1212_004980, partial [Trichoderma ghanense]